MKQVVLACVAACSAALLAPAPAAAQAESFPGQPMRIVVGFSAGSTTDILARAVAAKLQDAWGKPVVVDNRPGAGGVVASQQLLGAPQDGHTLMVVSAGHAVSAALYKNLPYNTEKDFAGVTLLATVPSILVVPPESKIQSVKQLVEAMRAKPGGYNYSSPGIGSANHLAGAMFASLAGVNVLHVPYKGIPQALQAAMTGEALYNFSPIVNVLPAAKGGKVVALATSTSKRSVAMPELPTVAEAGVGGYAFDPWFGLITSSGTPRPVVAKLNAEVVRILGLPDVNKQLLALGAEPSPIKPEAFDSLIREEIQKFAKVIRDANIKVE
ncbi:MAG TPA: tripartite tricarboxylate transporter substrate binding protein [Burkholderiales bacterium]|nr:tripartite tricarboxylate transporter substrate binding protein [Burkholderiales bacterium]